MRGTQTPDYYHLLGLSSSANSAEIKARYRALSKQHHPDVGGNQAEMSRINHAYSVLSDRFKRAIYDAERRRQLQLVAARPATRTAPAAAQTTTATSRPAPRNSASYGPITTKRSRWWPKIAVAFASIVIIAGMLLHLPIAEAISPAPDTANTSKPLEITYPPETNSQVVSNPGASFYTAPDGTSYSAPVSGPTPIAESKPETEKQENPENCQTKTYGPYQRTVCRDAEGTKICSVNVLGGQRFGDCD